MKRVILHIGTPKTGTTSLQWSFLQSRPQLIDLGLLYPSCGLSTDSHEFAHHPLARAAKAKLTTPWKSVVTEIQSSICDTAIISSEEMTALDSTSIEFIRDCLQGFELSIVAYLREQVDYIEAMYNQNIKTAKDTRTRDRFLTDFLATDEANYLKLLDRWTTALCPSKTYFRVYQKALLKNGDIIDDFSDLFSIPIDQIERPTRTLNAGVNNKYLELLRHVNMLDVSIGEKNPKIVSVLIDIESRAATRNPPLFNTEQRALISAFFEASNRGLAKRYFPGHPVAQSIFASNELPVGRVAPSSVDAEVLVPLLVHLLLKF